MHKHFIIILLWDFISLVPYCTIIVPLLLITIIPSLPLFYWSNVCLLNYACTNSLNVYKLLWLNRTVLRLFICELYRAGQLSSPKVTKVYLTLHSHPKFTLFIRLTFLLLTLHIGIPTFKFTILVISYKGLLQLYTTNPTFKSAILVISYKVLLQLYTVAQKTVSMFGCFRKMSLDKIR